MVADVFAELKWLGINCGMSLEYPKRKVWEESAHVLDNQVYVFGKQYHTQKMLEGQVDVILTDAPLINSIVYDERFGSDFAKVVRQRYDEFHNINVFLTRVRPYILKSKRQAEEEARTIEETKRVLREIGAGYVEFPGSKESTSAIAEYIMVYLKYQNIFQ